MIDIRFTEKYRLVGLLLACPCLSSPAKIAGLVSQLQSEIRDNKLNAQLASTKDDVLQLLNVCLDYSKFGALYEAVKFFDEGTPAFTRLQNYIFKPYLARQMSAFEKVRFITPMPLPAQPTRTKDKSDHHVSRLPPGLQMLSAHLTKYSAVQKSSPNVNELRHERNTEAQPIQVEDALPEYKHLVLLGEPGAGKTTTLHRLFEDYKQKWLDFWRGESDTTAHTPPFPLYVSLNLWDIEQYPNLESYILYQVGQVADCWWLAQLVVESFQTGSASSGSGEGNSQWLFLLDGLNEVPGLGRNQAQVVEDTRVSWIAEMCRDANLAVITCRVNDFIVPDTLVGKWKMLHTMPLGEAEIKQFTQTLCEVSGHSLEAADRFCALLFRTKGKLQYELTPQEQQVRKLQDLCSQPFYLIRLAWYYLYKGELPSRLVKLIDYMVDIALEWADKRDTANFASAVDRNVLIKQLALLAFNMTRRKKVGVDTFSQAAEWLFQLVDREQPQEDAPAPKQEQMQLAEAGEWLNQAGLANLVQRTPGRGVVFNHQLLQEYFAALYAKEHFFTSNLARDVLHDWQFREVRVFWQELSNSLERALEILERSVPSDGEPERAAAAAVLGEHSRHAQSARMLELLLSLVQEDTGGVVRSSAAVALGNYNKHPEAAGAIQPLIQALADSESSVRRNAAAALGEYNKHPEAAGAIQPLVQALADSESSVRRNAAAALGEYNKHPEARQIVQPLIQALADSESSVRRNAAAALGKYNKHPEAAGAIQPLIQALADSDEDVRRNAAAALGSYNKHPEAAGAIQPLVQALADSDEAVRGSAATALGEYNKHPEAEQIIQPLIQALADSESSVRRNAAAALGEYNKHPEAAGAIQPLVQALADSESSVRRNAAAALGEYNKHPEAAGAIQPLVQALADSESSVRRNAAAALGKYNKHPEAAGAIQPLIQALADSDEAVRGSAATALGEYNKHPEAEQIIQLLIQTLADGEADVRGSAAAALGKYNKHPEAAGAIQPLIQALSDSDENVQKRAAWALASFASPNTQVALTTFIQAQTPANYWVIWCFGWVSHNLKQYGQAVAAADRLLTLDPTLPRGYNLKAFSLLGQADGNTSSQQHAEVSQLFREAAQLSTTNDWDKANYIWMAWWVELPLTPAPALPASTRMGLYQIASELTNILSLADSGENTHIALTAEGVSQLLSGDGGYKTALTPLNEACSGELEEGEWDAPFWLGMAHAYTSDIPAAITALDRAMELELPKGLLFPLGWLEAHFGASSHQWQTLKAWWDAHA